MVLLQNLPCNPNASLGNGKGMVMVDQIVAAAKVCSRWLGSSFPKCLREMRQVK